MDSVEAEHSLSILGKFKEMKRERLICDFSILVGDEAMPVHRAVLAASSDYFMRLFSSADVNDPQNPFLMEDMEPRVLTTCIDFMYDGSAFINMEIVCGVLHAAKTLQLHRLVMICANFLEKSIALDSCFQIRAIAKDHDLLSVQTTAERFADENYDLVVQASVFQKVSSSEVMEFMGRTSNHVQKWQAAITWVKGHTEERLPYLEDMLKMIIAVKCPFDFLYETIFGHALIGKSQKLSILVAESLFETITPFNLSLGNCFDLLHIARTYEEQCKAEVFQFIRDYIAANFDTMSHTDGFMALDQEDLFGILDSQNFTIHPPETKWKAAVLWVKGDLQRRKCHVLQILISIDWSQCPAEFLQHHVYHEWLVKKSQDCAFTASSLLFSVLQNSDVNITNWYSLLEIAKANEGAIKSHEAQEKIFHFVVVNFAAVRKRNLFGKLSKEDITSLLMNATVKAMPEEVKWEAVLNWVKRDVQSRKVDLLDILKCCDMKTWQFRFLYRIVYSDELVQESDSHRELVISAFLSNLKEDDVSLDNCFDLLNLAKVMFADQAIERIKSCLVKNYEEVSKSTGFLSLEEADLFSILDSKKFTSCSEDTKWTPIFSWFMLDESRRNNLPEILDKLNLPSFSFRFLVTKIWPQDVVQTVPRCKEICLDAMLSNVEYHDISLVNWFELLELAKKTEHRNSREIIDKIYHFTAANFAQIQQQGHFGKLGKEEILFMMNSPEIISSSPAEQLHGTLEWLKTDMDGMDNAIEVLKSLKLEGFPFDLLFRVIREESLVAESAECTDVFLSAMQSNLRYTDINLENWHSLLAIVKENGPSKFGKIRYQVQRFVTHNFSTIFIQGHLKNLDVQDFHAVLRASELRVPEETKAQAILFWTKADEGRRHQELPNLLQLVTLERVPKSYIRDTICSDPMVMNSEQCKDMILKAMIAED